VRHQARIPRAHSQLELRLGSLALASSHLAAHEAGAVARAKRARPKARLSIRPGNLAYRGGRVKFAVYASHASRCTLSSKPRFFSGPNPRRVKCRGKQTLTLPAVTVGLHWSFKFTARNARGQVAVVTRKLVLRAPPFLVSANWSGYVVPSSSPVTEVSGRFVVPTLNCSDTSNGVVGTWVGIGGAETGSGDLLQTGVLSFCAGGVQDVSAAWWELVPPLPAQDFNSLSVSPGDVIQATVSQSPDGSWTTRLDDLTKGISGVMTTGKGFGTVLDSNPTVWLALESTSVPSSYAGGYTAEWIVEAPTDASTGSIIPLADFGNMAFTSLTTNLPSWELTGAEQVGLGAGPLLLAAPSAADPTGRGFSVTYTG
jgi:hypothetical protein